MLTDDQFNEMFLEATDMLYSLGLRLFRNQPEEANDFVQDVYLRARKKYSLFQGKSKFSTWLYRLALNHGLNTLNKKKKVLLSEKEELSQAGELVFSTEEESVLDRIIDKEVSEKIRAELDELPEAYRLCLVLYYFEKMTYVDIAEKLSLKEGTVKSHIHRGKKLLRDSLKGIR